jgi:hypothetical protein
MIDVDTRNFELYKNKRLPSLPNGDFIVIMDIDYSVFSDQGWADLFSGRVYG